MCLCIPGAREEDGIRGPHGLRGAGRENADRPALVLEYSSLRILVSKTQASRFLLLNLMDLRNKAVLMMLLFDFPGDLQITILLQVQFILSPASEEEDL